MTALPHQDPHVILDILRNCGTIAVVGFSSRKSRAGYYVPAYMQNNGYRIIPVNPALDSALGEKAYDDLLSIPRQVDLVLVFRRSEAVIPIVEQAVEINASAVWMQLGIFNEEAAEVALQNNVMVIMDACIMVEHRRLKAHL